VGCPVNRNRDCRGSHVGRSQAATWRMLGAFLV
jgi:hypothetical protein